jgi:hypothetical protein
VCAHSPPNTSATVDRRFDGSYHLAVTPTHRIHVLPWLRGLGGRVFIADWLAITVGRDIWCWRPLDEVELAHELTHVRQWQRYGTLFVAHYALASLVALMARRHWYRDNAFEVEAQSVAARVRRTA